MFVIISIHYWAHRQTVALSLTVAQILRSLAESSSWPRQPNRSFALAEADAVRLSISSET